MSAPPPNAPSVPAAPVRARPANLALATLGVVGLALLVVRGYSPQWSGTPSAQAVTPSVVNPNTADAAELRQVPGMGPSLTQAILAHREEHGPFKSVDDLAAVRGVGPQTLAKLRPWLDVPATGPTPTPSSASESPPRPPERKPSQSGGKMRRGDPPLDVNAASEGELQRLPGVGPVLAQRIADARAAKPFESVEELRKVRGIGAKTLESLRPFVRVGAASGPGEVARGGA